MYLFLSPTIWWVKRQWIHLSKMVSGNLDLFLWVIYKKLNWIWKKKDRICFKILKKVFLRDPEYTAKLTLQKCIGHQLKSDTKLTLVAINHCSEEKQIHTRLTSQWRTQIWGYLALRVGTARWMQIGQHAGSDCGQSSISGILQSWKEKKKKSWLWNI